MPRFWCDPATLLDGDDPATAVQWLKAVYSDQSLTTQYAPVPGTDLMWSTSSSTKPSLMAHMLGMLNIHTGHTVLEIGTGTGYNTALLCHRLGDTHVTSIDIDPDLVADARCPARRARLPPHPARRGRSQRGPRQRPLRPDHRHLRRAHRPTALDRPTRPVRDHRRRTIEHATTRWNQLGRPTRDRFGLTTTATVRDYWLDHPSNKLGDPTMPA